DQHQGGRFERFQEAGRESYGNAIVFPEDLPVAGLDVDFTRVQIVRRCTDIAAQSLLGGIVAGVRTRINIADPASCPQANVPDPAGILRSGYGVANDWGIR